MLGFGDRKAGETDEEVALMRVSRYGIGNKRTLEQAEEFTGINFKGKEMDVNKCGNLVWVPYEESHDYGIGETLSKGHAGEEVRPYVVKPDISRSVLEVQTLEQELLGVGGPPDYKLIGGLALAIFAMALKVLTRKKEKDESHKV